MRTKMKYKSVGARNLMEAISMNGFSVKRTNDQNAQTVYFVAYSGTFSEKVDFELYQKGGIVVFSVNALEIPEKQLIDRIRNKIEALKTTDHEDGYKIAIGHFVKGRYRAEDVYDGRSLSVEIIGISTDVLNRIAEYLAKEFNQKTLLVKNYEEKRTYLVK